MRIKMMQTLTEQPEPEPEHPCADPEESSKKFFDVIFQEGIL